MARLTARCLAFFSSVALVTISDIPATAATVAYWRFESTNDTTDLSGFGNHATQSAAGTSFTTDVFGTPVPRTGPANAGSIFFDNDETINNGADSADHFLTVNYHTSLDIATGSFTIEAWVRLKRTGSNPLRQYIVQKKAATSSDDDAAFVFMAKAGGLSDAPNEYAMAFGLPDGTDGNMIYSSLGLSFPFDNDWHYMSVGIDRSNGDVRFVLDDQVDLQTGVLNHATIDYSGIDNDDPLYIGAHSTSARSSGANWGFAGDIDELRISNTFLPQSQLLAVPEPASVMMAAAGVLMLGLLYWLRASATRMTPDKDHD